MPAVTSPVRVISVFLASIVPAVTRAPLCHARRGVEAAADDGGGCSSTAPAAVNRRSRADFRRDTATAVSSIAEPAQTRKRARDPLEQFLMSHALLPPGVVGTRPPRKWSERFTEEEVDAADLSFLKLFIFCLPVDLHVYPRWLRSCGSLRVDGHSSNTRVTFRETVSVLLEVLAILAAKPDNCAADSDARNTSPAALFSTALAPPFLAAAAELLPLLSGLDAALVPTLLHFCQRVFSEGSSKHQREVREAGATLPLDSKTRKLPGVVSVRAQPSCGVATFPSGNSIKVIEAAASAGPTRRALPPLSLGARRFLHDWFSAEVLNPPLDQEAVRAAVTNFFLPTFVAGGRTWEPADTQNLATSVRVGRTVGSGEHERRETQADWLDVLLIGFQRFFGPAYRRERRTFVYSINFSPGAALSVKDKAQVELLQLFASCWDGLLFLFEALQEGSLDKSHAARRDSDGGGEGGEDEPRGHSSALVRPALPFCPWEAIAKPYLAANGLVAKLPPTDIAALRLAWRSAVCRFHTEWFTAACEAAATATWDAAHGGGSASLRGRPGSFEGATASAAPVAEPSVLRNSSSPSDGCGPPLASFSATFCNHPVARMTSQLNPAGGAAAATAFSSNPPYRARGMWKAAKKPAVARCLLKLQTEIMKSASGREGVQGEKGLPKQAQREVIGGDEITSEGVNLARRFTKLLPAEARPCVYWSKDDSTVKISFRAPAATTYALVLRFFVDMLCVLGGWAVDARRCGRACGLAALDDLRVPAAVDFIAGAASLPCLPALKRLWELAAVWHLRAEGVLDEAEEDVAIADLLERGAEDASEKRSENDSAGYGREQTGASTPNSGLASLAADVGVTDGAGRAVVGTLCNMSVLPRPSPQLPWAAAPTPVGKAASPAWPDKNKRLSAASGDGFVSAHTDPRRHLSEAPAAECLLDIPPTPDEALLQVLRSRLAAQFAIMETAVAARSNLHLPPAPAPKRFAHDIIAAEHSWPAEAGSLRTSCAVKALLTPIMQQLRPLEVSRRILITSSDIGFIGGGLDEWVDFARHTLQRFFPVSFSLRVPSSTTMFIEYRGTSTPDAIFAVVAELLSLFCAVCSSLLFIFDALQTASAAGLAKEYFCPWTAIAVPHLARTDLLSRLNPRQTAAFALAWRIFLNRLREKWLGLADSSAAGSATDRVPGVPVYAPAEQCAPDLMHAGPERTRSQPSPLAKRRRHSSDAPDDIQTLFPARETDRAQLLSSHNSGKTGCVGLYHGHSTD